MQDDTLLGNIEGHDIEGKDVEVADEEAVAENTSVPGADAAVDVVVGVRAAGSKPERRAENSDEVVPSGDDSTVPGNGGSDVETVAAVDPLDEGNQTNEPDDEGVSVPFDDMGDGNEGIPDRDPAGEEEAASGIDQNSPVPGIPAADGGEAVPSSNQVDVGETVLGSSPAGQGDAVPDAGPANAVETAAGDDVTGRADEHGRVAPGDTADGVDGLPASDHVDEDMETAAGKEGGQSREPAGEEPEQATEENDTDLNTTVTVEVPGSLQDNSTAVGQQGDPVPAVGVKEPEVSKSLTVGSGALITEGQASETASGSSGAASSTGNGDLFFDATRSLDVVPGSQEPSLPVAAASPTPAPTPAPTSPPTAAPTPAPTSPLGPAVFMQMPTVTSLGPACKSIPEPAAMPRGLNGFAAP